MNKAFRYIGNKRSALASLALLAPLAAFAVDDDAVTAITAAQTKGLAVAAAFVAMAIAIWAALYIKGFFGKR